MNLALVGFGGPVVILLLFQLLFWRGLRHLWLRLIFIYVFGVATGILSDLLWKVGQLPSALIAGIVAPLLYCTLFTIVSAGRRRAAAPASGGSVVRTGGLSPTIVAAIIQAIATIIVAIIANS